MRAIVSSSGKGNGYVVYTIVFKPQAFKQFKKLPHEIQRRLKICIDAMQNQPRPDGVKKLAGLDSLYRVRVGDYRIVYQVEEKKLTVLVVKIGHRKEIYR